MMTVAAARGGLVMMSVFNSIARPFQRCSAQQMLFRS
jgi:hypothetical protein